MRIPDETKNCVVFIGVETAPGKVAYCGTGFFVSVKSKRLPRYSFPYFVTARHVVAELRGRPPLIRTNTKDGKSIIFKLEEDTKWWFHPDEVASCDVAAVPANIPPDIHKHLEYAALPIEILVTDEMLVEEAIGIGDEIFIVGLFSHHHGNEKNHPIVRMGTIAMIPDDLVPTTHFGNMEVYLIECRSIGGLSGSPVFVAKQTTFTKWKVRLLGLIHGHWDVNPEQTLDVTTSDSKNKAGLNVGIAMVAPAKKIVETINRRELADRRTEVENMWLAKNPPKQSD